MVSPGIGRLLSSLEAQSALLEEARNAAKSLGSVKRKGSGKSGVDALGPGGQVAEQRDRGEETPNVRAIHHDSPQGCSGGSAFQFRMPFQSMR